jgi:uncharacterized protein VirK/YbjX
MYQLYPDTILNKTNEKARQYYKIRIRSFINYFKTIKIIRHLKKHRELKEILKPISNYPVIKITNRIYTFSYLSKKLSTEGKLEILSYHYRYIQEILPFSNIEALFKGGLICWSEKIGGDNLTIKLAHNYLEFEGSLSLDFYVNDVLIYKLAFTIVDGSNVNVEEPRVLYVTLLQGTIGQMECISKVTKNLQDLIPSTILMCVLEGIGVCLGIKSIVGVCSRNQLCYSHEIASNHYNNYDAFWNSQGAVEMYDGDYLLSCPLKLKPINLIKAKYRNRTLTKRAKRAEIIGIALDAFASYLNKTFAPSMQKASFQSAFVFAGSLLSL